MLFHTEHLGGWVSGCKEGVYVRGARRVKVLGYEGWWRGATEKAICLTGCKLDPAASVHPSGILGIIVLLLCIINRFRLFSFN